MRTQFLLSGSVAILLCCLLILLPVSGEIFIMPRALEPVGAYTFNEGTGEKAVDSSGNGNYGTFTGNVSRIANGGCVKGLVFDGTGGYIAIPASLKNHPTGQVTVETRLLLNDLTTGPVVSTLNNGGYCLGFGDGNDLWWTVNVKDVGDVSVPLRHEDIPLNTWHLVAATYDGRMLKIFLDGKMLASKETSGLINYTSNNYVMVGAEAGTANVPAPGTTWFRGALDELRIYDVALSNGEVIDDMTGTCSPQIGEVSLNLSPPGAGPGVPAGSLALAAGENVTETLRFDSGATAAPWHVTVPPGSILAVSMQDLPATYPDTWQVEITDGTSTLASAAWTPGQPETSAKAVIIHGSSDVVIRYQGGSDRFPAFAGVRFAAEPAPVVVPTKTPEAPAWNMTLILYPALGVLGIIVAIGILWLYLRKKEAGSGNR